MRIRVCPECYKAFYMSQDEDCIICPHCGYIFSERRIRERVKKQLDITFYHEGSEVTARTVDYSEDGAGIIYKGDSLEVDTVLDVDFGELNLRRPARTVWAKKVSRSVVSAGLMLL